MKLQSLFLTIYAMLLLAAPSAGAAPRAANYSFNHLTTKDGLSSSCVKAIAQDSYGFMWLGTKNGLNRYDGHLVKRYNCYDYAKKRGNNNISALYEAPDGKMWIGTDRGVYILDLRTGLFDFLSVKSARGISADDWVQTIMSDPVGNTWILVPSQGVFRYRDGKITDYCPTIEQKDRSDVMALFSDHTGGIYISVMNQGLFKYDPDNDRFVRSGNNGEGFGEFANDILLFGMQTPDRNLLLCTEHGRLYHYDIASEELSPIEFPSFGRLYARAMVNVGNEIWIGTNDGIHIINILNGKEHFITEESGNPFSLSAKTIWSLNTDHEGNVWVGTMSGGVDMLQRHGFRFERYTHTPFGNSLSGKCLRGVACDAMGHIIAGTEMAGYNILDPVTGNVSRFSPSTDVLTMRPIGDKVLVGTAREGAMMVGIGYNATQVFSDIFPGGTSIYSALADREGNLWLGTELGLFIKPAGEEKPHFVEATGRCWAFDLKQDSRGLIWLAAMGDGVWTYNPATAKWRHYPYDEKYSNGLRSNSVSAIAEDSKGNIWISSDRGGLSRYDARADKFVTYTKADGLPDNVVFDVLEDNNGFLWFGTNSGLVKFDPKTKKSIVFTTDDGLPDNEFNYHTAAVGKDGYFYFGTMNGLVAFNPALAQSPDTIAPVYFTSMRMGNRDVEPYTEGSPLKSDILFADEVTLPHDYPGLTLTVASPGNTLSGSVRYYYRLLPSDTTWYEISNGELQLASLSPGTYDLQVKADNGSVESIRSLKLKIKSPWYATIWAKLVYALLLLGLGGFSFWYYRRLKERQLRENERLFKVSKEKELYENKVSFFTELAHEIRTPLSLIDAPLQAIEELDTPDVRVKRYVRVMKQNTERLLNLTGQLLDFQKIGAEKFELKFEKVDITALVTESVARFEPSMVLKGKKVTSSISEQTIYAVVDREAVTKILSNMLNNALKYSDTMIDVSLKAEGDDFVVRVTSDGGKISPENTLRIFEPFFQVDNKADNNGVGIGLPLCRTLASLMHGSIEVEDTPGETNTFALRMPMKQPDVEAETPDLTVTQVDEYVMKGEEEPAHDTVAPDQSCSILLVEDNDQMRDFLYDQLSENFVVQTAVNGEDALQKIQQYNFDLIVTDIMMPVMDGYELCKAVKNDINRSHIPVVFLTAKNDLESKVRALKCGGEAYIEKPFSIKFFREQILSLLENRRHERNAFLKQPFFTIDSMKLTAADREFMDKVIANISENIADENFSVESMADVFCMSRSSLLRKIKTLFNQSPIELIRTVKLKKAAELIQENKYRIGDVCYMVGINSPSYFSKLFFRQFGLSPKEFEKQCKARAKSIINAGSTQE